MKTNIERLKEAEEKLDTLNAESVLTVVRYVLETLEGESIIMRAKEIMAR